ncbi:MAG: tyrosinase family protein, partial [Pseudomonadota bacterium]
ELDKLPFSNRNSWRFLAGIHGCDPQGWVDNEIADSVDEIPDEIKLPGGPYGQQCQHQSWLFLSWHRGYLAAFEAIVAAKVKELTGKDWALPYWNYLNESNPDARKVPAALLAPTLPDQSPNPLVKYRRWTSTTELREPTVGRGVSLESMKEDDFIVGDDGTIGFGGGRTDGFSHFAGQTGDLEGNPHNTVHNEISGAMGNPQYAALDPIFWLHHCNIDRLWEAWMQTPGKTLDRDPLWLDGPLDRTFLMPRVGGADPGEKFTGRDTLAGGKFHPTYDSLTLGTGVTPGGIAVAGVSMGPSAQQTVDPIGSNDQAITLADEAVATTVSLDPAANQDMIETMGNQAQGERVSRLYVAIEGIRSTDPSSTVEVYVGLNDGERLEETPETFAGELSLFGLNVASEIDGPHGGNGINMRLDITDLVQQLRAADRLDGDKIPVTLLRVSSGVDPQPLEVRAIVFYRRTGVVQ